MSGSMLDYLYTLILQPLYKVGISILQMKKLR